MGLGKLKFLLQDSTNEPQRCLKSMDPKFDHEVLRTSRCVPGSDKGLSKPSDGTWDLDLKPEGSQQANSQSLMCGHLVGLARLFRRSVLTGQPGLLLEHGINVPLVLTFLALRCIGTRRSFWIKGCKLRFQTFGRMFSMD